MQAQKEVFKSKLPFFIKATTVIWPFYKAFPVAPGINFCSCFSDTLKASPREREKEKQALFPSPNKDSKTQSKPQKTSLKKSGKFSSVDHIVRMSKTLLDC